MRKANRGFRLSAIATVLLMFLKVPFLTAQDYDDNSQDPPARAGRIGYVQGAVSFQPNGEGDWLDAVPNRPLTTGDNLWADRDARAEVQIGSTSIRLAPETSLTFLDLGSNIIQLRLSVGSVLFRVRHLDDGENFEVDTPNLAFNVYQPGEYRVDVNENGDQTIARVFHGEGEITGGGSSYRLMEGQEGHFSGLDQLSYDVGGIGSQDDFERWAFDLDRRQDNFRSARYVSTEMTGYEDMDEYGDWRNVDGYGSVWSPRGVSADWAPYRYGHWVYISPWGWTWVEDEPWGFAPFHYGRWVYADRWCWVPGPVAVRPVYSPALVAFVGGGGFSIGVGVGSGVGWFPLAPGEVYVPWYRTSPRYVQNVNVTNTRVTVVQVTNVYNNVTVNRVNNITYVNQRGGRGITVVNHDTFVNARPVYRNIERVDTRRMASAPVTHEVVRTIQPSRESYIGAARTVRQSPPAPVMNRQVVATRQPVVMNRPAAPGMTRAVAPPQVRTVRPVPVNQAETLNRGARGQTRGGGNAPAPANGGPGAPNRPGSPNATDRPGSPDHPPGATDNNRPANAGNNRPGQDNNRPGAGNNRPDNNRQDNSRANMPGNRPGAPDNSAKRPVPRPGNQDNRSNNQDNHPNNDRGEAVPRQGNPNQAGRQNEGQRPAAPDNTPNPSNNNAGRPVDSGNNRHDRNVPRSSRQDQNRPDQNVNQPDRGPNGSSNGNGNDRQERQRMPQQSMPQSAPVDNRPSAPANRPTPQDSRPGRPDNRPVPNDDNRPSMPENRHVAAPPETRQAPSPRPEPQAEPSRPESRGQSAPSRESRPMPSDSRPQSNPAGGRQDHPNRPEPSGNGQRGNDNKDKDKQNDRLRFR